LGNGGRDSGATLIGARVVGEFETPPCGPRGAGVNAGCGSEGGTCGVGMDSIVRGAGLSAIVGGGGATVSAWEGTLATDMGGGNGWTGRFGGRCAATGS
jgi:hypothetical protein